MKVKIDIDESNEETIITIHAKEWTEELAALVSKIQSQSQSQSLQSKRLVGLEDERSILLEPADIDYIYAENRKVFAALPQRRIELKMKLYEIEELLIPHQFMRFSKSVIGNLDQISRFELAFNGTLCVHFKSGSKEYVSRGYVAELKQRLIMGGDRDEG
ncbi:LytTR family transcriptional regulator [Paenibacillaceae bacterium]|nr:LytTR family transcriptional regulator [Paenibacillaceae bacterium]